MNKIFRVIWSHVQQAWVVVSELVKSHTKTSAYTDKRAQVCTSDYFLDKQQDKFKLSLLSLVLLGIFFSPVGLAAYFQDSSGPGRKRLTRVLLVLVKIVTLGLVLLPSVGTQKLKVGLVLR
ncbi:ESPR domain-containing protein [Glaesserella parasuis]|uniref:ESPR domain-containing protein n=1 Tax=Glaesserella parasuis TaxID=738 RepID=UPI0024362F64|nr:ESPR domain-containing protein [Glaesserella parasuis]MDG6856584.1 ESPR domain-containing protein [Glaesserella parasuis]